MKTKNAVQSLRGLWLGVGLGVSAALAGCSPPLSQDVDNTDVGKSAADAGKRHGRPQIDKPPSPVIQPVVSSVSRPAPPAVPPTRAVGYLTQAGARGQEQRLAVVISLPAKLLIPREAEFEGLRSGKSKAQQLTQVPSRHHVRVLDPKRFTITLADGRAVQADSVLFRPENDPKCIVTIIGGRHVETDTGKPFDPEEVRRYAVGVRVEAGEVRPPLRISVDAGPAVEVPAQLVALPSAPFEVPKFDIPKFDIPKLDIPKFVPPKIPTFAGPSFVAPGRGFTIPGEGNGRAFVPHGRTPAPKGAPLYPASPSRSTSRLTSPSNKVTRPAAQSKTLQEHHPSSEDKANAMIKMARVFAEKRPDKAREYAEKIIDLAPDSEPAKEARALLQQLAPVKK